MEKMTEAAGQSAERAEIDQTPVLIVGAGPVGLALTNELGYRGIRSILVEQGEGKVFFPAGEGIFSRTMEHLRRWGISDRARHHHGFPDDYPLNVGFATSLAGRLIALFEAPSNGDMPKMSADSPEGIMICPKQVFDPLLRHAAEGWSGSDLRYQTQFLGFQQDDEGVVARLKDLRTEREYEIRTSYLAACDGARSSIRKQLGIAYVGTFGEGHNFAVSFRAPALAALIKERFGAPLFQLHTINTSHRPYFTAVDGRDNWRMSMYVEEDADPDPATAVKDAIGIPMDVEVMRAQPWAGHRVVAQKYREKRVFLLGDAAHLRWPKGGFGANTGIGDAVDLGWKLAATFQGWGGANLLDSYETERRPVAVRNVNEAANNRILDSLIAPDPALDADSETAERGRRKLENAIHALRLREFRTQGLQLGYRYRNSPIVVADGSLEPPDDHMIYHPSTWPGSRAPHAWIAEGRSTLDLFGKGFVLIRFDDGKGSSPFGAAAKACNMPFEEVQISRSDIRQLFEREYVLVRPDGHVAWRSNSLPQDPGAVIDQVRGVPA